MSQSLRASKTLVARLGSRSLMAPRRTFAVSAPIRMPDLIQDMYLKELRAYKAPAAKAGDAEAHVQKFSPPATPKSPEEANLSSEIQAYEDSAVEVEGQAAAGETTDTAEGDYFEDLKQFDEEAPAHH